MPMIATTTRCPSCSAPGSSARTDTSGTSRLVTPAADSWSAIASCATAPWTTACRVPPADSSTSSSGS